MAKCKRCFQKIVWGQTPNGSWRPLEANLTPHVCYSNEGARVDQSEEDRLAAENINREYDDQT